MIKIFDRSTLFFVKLRRLCRVQIKSGKFSFVSFVYYRHRPDIKFNSFISGTTGVDRSNLGLLSVKFRWRTDDLGLF